nr:filamentous hemagglutinin N-terminal domain-containing protein [uncultured Selenomonas sp.]
MKQAAGKHLRRAVAYALFAGAIAAPFAASPAYALPVEGANAAANAAEATITTEGTVMDIVGKNENNLLYWQDFSIDAGEKVRFDAGAPLRNYLNLVKGEAMSRIYGTMEGGWNVYLVNPHGILFAESAQVNTGALYLSTAKTEDLNTSVFRGGTTLSVEHHSMAMC